MKIPLYRTFIVFLAASLIYEIPTVQAADKTWNNTGTDFNTSGSWSGGLPTAADRALFSSAAVQQPDLSANIDILSARFTSAGTGYTISSSAGATMNLLGTGTLSFAALSAATNTTINAAVNLGAAAGSTQSFYSESTGTTLYIAQSISGGSATSTLSLSGSSGAAAITLGGNNNYSGTTTLSTVNLNINSATALGSSALVLNSGTLNNTSGGAVTLINNNTQTWNNNITFTGTNSLNMGAGAVSLGSTAGASRTVTVNGSSLTVAGVVSDGTHATTPAKNIAKAGAGALILSGANVYTGATTVNGGALLVNGTHTGGGAYSINSGGVLGGSGAIVTAGNAGITLASGSKLSPGGGADNSLSASLGSGSLNISAAVGGANTGGLIFELGIAASSDAIILSSGTLNIGTGVLEFSDFDFTAIAGFGSGTYTLFDTSSAITGTLGASLTGSLDGGAYEGTLSLANSSNDLVLVVNAVPEPSMLAMVLCGLAVQTALRRRRSRQTACRPCGPLSSGASTNV